jgi:KDO2-lipid IV(A) lauroyltransferase
MQTVGALVGWIVWFSSTSYRKQFLINIKSAGLSWSQTKGAVSAAGKMLGEIPWLWARDESKRALDRTLLGDISFIERALNEKRGVIVLAPHLGSWELGAQLLGEILGPKYGDLVALYRPARKAWVDELLIKFRGREHLTFVPTSLAGVRALLRHLKSGGFTAILPDQVPPKGLGVWAPFFGRDVYTMTLLPKLAQQTGALIVLGWCERLPGARYKCTFKDLSSLGIGDKSRTLQDAAAIMNKAVEGLVLEFPDQYLWGYNRDKQPRDLPIHATNTKPNEVSGND